jgi:hypothetical protein
VICGDAAAAVATSGLRHEHAHGDEDEADGINPVIKRTHAGYRCAGAFLADFETLQPFYN